MSEIERKATVIAKAANAESHDGPWEIRVVRALSAAGLLATDEMRACVAACEGFAGYATWSSDEVERCMKAGRASLKAKEPRERFYVENCAGSSKVKDRQQLQPSWVAEFCGAGNVADAREWARVLNERAK